MMIPKVRDWLQAQGFTLEMHAASAFRAAGFEVRQSSHYIDPETGKGREIDVVARDPDILGIIDITFIVECKSSKKPWVLLCSPDTVVGYNRFFALVALSEKALGVLAGRVTELLPKFDWLRKGGLIGYGLRQALSDSDVAYTAAIGLATACDSWIHPPEGAYAPPYSFAFPVMVVDSPILQCSLGHGERIEISEVDTGEFLFVARFPRYFGSCIRVVSLSRLQAFAQEAKIVAGFLRTELKSAEQRVRDSWRAETPKEGA
jgi:hypothetical protein